MIEYYIEWFEKNLSWLTMVDPTITFCIEYDGQDWTAGYKYYEPYDSCFFIDNMMGVAKDVNKAVSLCYDNSSKVVENLDRFVRHLRLDDLEVGKHYKRIALRDSLQFLDIVYTGSDDRYSTHTMHRFEELGVTGEYLEFRSTFIRQYHGENEQQLESDWAITA